MIDLILYLVGFVFDNNQYEYLLVFALYLNDRSMCSEQQGAQTAEQVRRELIGCAVGHLEADTEHCVLGQVVGRRWVNAALHQCLRSLEAREVIAKVGSGCGWRDSGATLLLQSQGGEGEISL